MHIEAGKTYRTRNGTQAGPMVYCGVSGWPFTLSDEETLIQGQPPRWREDGTFDANEQPHAMDLVAEWVDAPKPIASDPVALTSERKNQHGDWTVQAGLARGLKSLMHQQNWDELTSGQKEALDMIAVKISRILSGDPNHADHWDDIAGYAYLGKGGHGK